MTTKQTCNFFTQQIASAPLATSMRFLPCCFRVVSTLQMRSKLHHVLASSLAVLDSEQVSRRIIEDIRLGARESVEQALTQVVSVRSCAIWRHLSGQPPRSMSRPSRGTQAQSFRGKACSGEASKYGGPTPKPYACKSCMCSTLWLRCSTQTQCKARSDFHTLGSSCRWKNNMC